MYAVNGIPLDSATFGWVLRAPTRPLSEVVRRRQTLSVSGSDGVVGGLSSTTEPVVLTFVVQTPREHLETLNALFGDGGTLTQIGLANRAVAFEVLSSTPGEGWGAGDEFVDMRFTIRLPGAFWRAVTTATSAAAVLASSVAVTGLFPGISAPVQDAIVRVKGACTGVQVTDTSGAWLTLPDLTATQYARFHLATKECFITSSNTWSGGTDASGLVDFGGPRSGFEFTPRLDPANPSIRDARLTVTAVSWSGATLEVRGRSAHQF